MKHQSAGPEWPTDSMLNVSSIHDHSGNKIIVTMNVTGTSSTRSPAETTTPMMPLRRLLLSAAIVRPVGGPPNAQSAGKLRTDDESLPSVDIPINKMQLDRRKARVRVYRFRRRSPWATLVAYP